MKTNRRGNRFFVILFMSIFLIFMVAGCGSKAEDASDGQKESGVTDTAGKESETQDGSGAQEGNNAGSDTESSQATPDEEDVTLKIGALKGPTTMGLLFLMEDQKAGKTKNSYEFQMATGADELLPLMVSGKLDVALVPANVAAILYQKTSGGVAVIDVNTLGVLYLVSSDPEVKGIGDLKGRTIYLTGMGTTPDCVLQYLLNGYGYQEGDVTLEYKSEAAEVAAILAEKEDALGFLPQPFVTAACLQNEKLQIVCSANDEWTKLQTDGEKNGLVTGVTVIRKEILEKYPNAVQTFLEEHAASAKAINEDVETGAALAVEAGIVGKEPIAKKAIPNCNITCLTGEEMKKALEAYLNVLFDFDKTTVGGQLPGEDFYFVK